MTDVRLPIRPFRNGDIDECVRMSIALYPESAAEDHGADFEISRQRPDAEIFVIERANGSLGGFVEVAARAYADGCVTTPVGYIEAWYVDADLRKRGYGRALLDAAEGWARAQGYREMASDAYLENETSHRAHERSGYEVVDRVVQFRKSIG